MNKMIMKLLAASICAIILLPAFAWSEDNAIPFIDEREDQRGGLVLPEVFQQYQDFAEEEIKRKNNLESLDQDIENVNYNEDGTIGSVLYHDGTIINYSYTYTANNELEACTLENGDVKIVIRKEGEERGVGSGRPAPFVIEIYEKPKSEPSEPQREKPQPAEDKPLIKYHPKIEIDLQDIATKPIKFDFKEIKEAITKTAELKDNALREYENNTSAYYDEIENRLKNTTLGEFFKAPQEKDASESERRGAIDETMAYIYSMAKQDDGKLEVREFLAFERDLREKILMPAKEIYDGKIDAALKYLHGVIDKLLEARLVLYLNTTEDKIDAIINLPQNTKQEK